MTPSLIQDTLRNAPIFMSCREAHSFLFIKRLNYVNEEVEIWKDVEGYEGSYQVSSFGRVRGVDRLISYIARGGTPAVRLQRGKVLKTSVGTSGYETYHMYDVERDRQTLMVHRIVAKTFIPLVAGNDFVNHKDGDKLNNHISNLEWVTKSENTLHAIDTGLLLKRGEDSNLSKLTEVEVTEILSLRKYGRGKYTCRQIAARYKISTEYASEIARSDKWLTLKNNLTDFKLKQVYDEVSSLWGQPDKIKRKIPVNDISFEVSCEIISRRENGERVCDIARDLGLNQKFVSWYYLKNKAA